MAPKGRPSKASEERKDHNHTRTLQRFESQKPRGRPPKEIDLVASLSPKPARARLSFEGRLGGSLALWVSNLAAELKVAKELESQKHFASFLWFLLWQLCFRSGREQVARVLSGIASPGSEGARLSQFPESDPGRRGRRRLSESVLLDFTREAGSGETFSDLTPIAQQKVLACAFLVQLVWRYLGTEVAMEELIGCVGCGVPDLKAAARSYFAAGGVFSDFAEVVHIRLAFLAGSRRYHNHLFHTKDGRRCVKRGAPRQTEASKRVDSMLFVFLSWVEHAATAAALMSEILDFLHAPGGGQRARMVIGKLIRQLLRFELMGRPCALQAVSKLMKVDQMLLAYWPKFILSDVFGWLRIGARSDAALRRVVAFEEEYTFFGPAPRQLYARCTGAPLVVSFGKSVESMVNWYRRLAAAVGVLLGSQFPLYTYQMEPCTYARFVRGSKAMSESVGKQLTCYVGELERSHVVMVSKWAAALPAVATWMQSLAATPEGARKLGTVVREAARQGAFDPIRCVEVGQEAYGEEALARLKTFMETVV